MEKITAVPGTKSSDDSITPPKFVAVLKVLEEATKKISKRYEVELTDANTNISKHAVAYNARFNDATERFIFLYLNNQEAPYKIIVRIESGLAQKYMFMPSFSKKLSKFLKKKFEESGLNINGAITRTTDDYFGNSHNLTALNSFEINFSMTAENSKEVEKAYLLSMRLLEILAGFNEEVSSMITSLEA